MAKLSLYRLLSLHNDIKALAKGRLPQRLVRKVVYKHTLRAASWITKLLGVSK